MQLNFNPFGAFGNTGIDRFIGITPRFKPEIYSNMLFNYTEDETEIYRLE